MRIAHSFRISSPSSQLADKDELLPWLLQFCVWRGCKGGQRESSTMRAVSVTLVMLPKKREMQANKVKVIAPPLPWPNFAWKAS